SSGLSDNDIERMVKEAESHSEEDKQRRRQVEARNQLDGLVYNTQKTYDEHKEKLAAADKGLLEEALAEARKALEGDDVEAMEKAGQHLTQASHKLAEVMYQAQAQGAAAGAGPGGASGGAGGPGGGRPAGGAGASDEVIDAEYVDV